MKIDRLQRQARGKHNGMCSEIKQRFPQIVTVKGLVNAKEHNGKQGQIEDYAEERGRFMVELDEVRRRKLVAARFCQ